MHNFPPHLSHVATLPENTLQPNRDTGFLWASGSEEIMADVNNNLEISHSD